MTSATSPLAFRRFIGDPAQALADVIGRAGKVDADALMAVRPVFAEAEEKILAGDDEDFSLFQPFVEFAGGDLEPLEPEPVEKCALARVQSVVDSAFAEKFMQPFLRLLIPLAIKRPQHRPPDLENPPALDQRLHQTLPDIPVRQPNNRRHRRHRRRHLGRTDHNSSPRPRQPELRQTQS